jgi:selenide,water dikinase
LRAHGVRSCTDLTGFGLLGHLLEMTRPSGVDVELEWSALPLLDGAVESAAAGHLSSLHASNAQFRSALQSVPSGHAVLDLLFDPQTAGGLLAGVPAAQAPACLRALRSAGYPQAAVIGRVCPRSDAPAPVRIRD